MQKEQVQDHFRRQVPKYSDLMCRLIPEYDFQARLLVDLIPFDTATRMRVLDLGAGPAILAELVLERYPNASVIAFDVTEEMLEASQIRCKRFGERFRAAAGDFKNDDFGVGYDAVVAGLTLHHLNDAERQGVFWRIFSALNDNGIFLAREIVADDDPFVAAWHYRLWRSFMTANGEDADSWYQKHLAKDHPASVEKQLAWLKQAGFRHVACHWRYLNFAVLSAQRTDA